MPRQVNKAFGVVEWPQDRQTLGNLGFLFWGYIKDKDKIWDVLQPQQPMTIQRLSGTIGRDCRALLAVLVQTAFHDMVNRCRCQNAAGNSFPNAMHDQFAI